MRLLPSSCRDVGECAAHFAFPASRFRATGTYVEARLQTIETQLFQSCKWRSFGDKQVCKPRTDINFVNFRARLGTNTDC